jgi:thiamine pyrophosphate-dependent acetolactate synthase large subunit-like protein
MAQPTVADFLLHRLGAWNVRRIYGYPGDSINGIMGALARQEHIEHDRYQAEHGHYCLGP